MNRTDQPLAIIKWDFMNTYGGRCAGSHAVDYADDARAMSKKLNEIWGDGTHWVETQNYTKAERDAGVLP